MAHTKPSEWLAELDSHSLYHAEMLDEIPGVTVVRDNIPGAGGGPIAVLYRDDHGGTPVRVRLQTLAQVAGDPGRTGVTLVPKHNPDQLVFSGFYIASRVASLFLGDSPGDAKTGRGFAYKANLAALRDAGF